VLPSSDRLAAAAPCTKRSSSRTRRRSASFSRLISSNSARRSAVSSKRDVAGRMPGDSSLGAAVEAGVVAVLLRECERTGGAGAGGRAVK
jgi:hypothetical protein